MFLAPAMLLLGLGSAVGPEARDRVSHAPSDDCEYSGFMEPTWSPDGRWIAAINWYIIVPIYFIEMDLATFDPISREYASCFVWVALSRPAWSPDGQEIAFSGGGQDIMVTPANECGWPDFRIVQTGMFAQELAWSPEGTRIAFSFGGDIWSVASMGGDVRRLVSDASVDAQPAWSPDGRWLAFASNRAGSSDIWIMPTHGGEAVQVTDDAANDTWPTWSPDSQFIAFASDRSGGTHVWSVAHTGGTPVQITHGPGSETAPAWCPDGQRIAYLETIGYCEYVGIETDLRVVNVQERSWSEVKRLFR